MNITFRIRPATADDAPVIAIIVRAAMLYPLGLDWRRFIIVEQHHDVAGIGQVKPHRDGTRELSIAVVAEWQRAGVGSALMEYLIAQAGGVLHLVCLNAQVPFYQRFGFRVLVRDDIPRSLRPVYRITNSILYVFRRSERLVVMKRDIN